MMAASATSNGHIRKIAARMFRRSDREFLPAALEILERPPSPVSLIMAGTLVALVVSVLIWSIASFTDIVAIAPGKIEPSGRVKLVQPLETGRVTQIHVRNGDRVKAGDVLISLDDRDARGEYDYLFTSFIDALAESIRHDSTVKFIDLYPDISLSWPQDVPPAIRAREESVLQSDLALFHTMIGSISANIRQKMAERDRYESIIAAQSELMKIVTERVTMRSALADTGAGSKSNLIDARETLGRIVSELKNSNGQLEESIKNIESLETEKAKLRASFIADHMTKYSTSSRDADGLLPRVRKAKARLDNMQLISPSDGIVSASAVTSLGQVLTSGQEVMRIVPDHQVIEAEIYLQNKDIGFVREGQDVSVKIDTFPFTRYGLVKAKVSRVATDAVAQPELLQAATDPSRPLDTKNSGGTQRVHNLVYPAIITFEDPSIKIDDIRIPLSPGMTLTAEIKTGHRRLIDYILSPIREVTSESMRER